MSRRQIAIFVHPTEGEFADAVETAAFVAEYAVRSGARLLLAATPSAALDVCLNLVGDAVGRTVEGESAQHRQWSSFLLSATTVPSTRRS